MQKIFNDFGYCPILRTHCIDVHISKSVVSFIENTHAKHRIHGPEPIIEKAVLSLATWKRVATSVAKELNRRIKADDDLKNCPQAKWVEGKNQVDLSLGRELLVLVWAMEQLEDSPEGVETILQAWSALSPEDRFFFYRMINASTGRVQDRETFRRKGLACLLLGNLDRLPKKIKLSSDLDVLSKKKKKNIELFSSKNSELHSHPPQKTGGLPKTFSVSSYKCQQSSLVGPRSSCASLISHKVSLPITEPIKLGKKRANRFRVQKQPALRVEI